MSTLAETISSALTRLGPETEDRLHDVVCEFASLNLCDEDRLCVLATALAAAAATHHRRHKPVFLEAVRTWSLEIAVGLAPVTVRLATFAADGSIAEGADIIVSGLDALLDSLTLGAATIQDRLVLELTLFAQLFGRHDANAIHLALMAVADAIGEADFRPGRVVRVTLGDMVMPLGRDTCLASVAPRGIA